MSDIAVFVDGPLKGQAFPIPPAQQRSVMTYGSSREEQVLYRFCDISMFSRTVLVGSLVQPPDSEACFEVLCSENAKLSAGFPG